MTLNLDRSLHQLALLEQERNEARMLVEALTLKFQSMSQTIAGLQEELRPHIANPVDLRGAVNVGERITRIATAAGGWLHMSRALDTIMQSGITSAQRTTIRSEISRWIRTHPADWESIAIGVYRYRRFGELDAEDG